MLLEFIKTNGSSIAVVLVLLGLALWSLRSGRKDIARQIIFGLVVQAEKLLGSNTGQAKLAVVYSMLPNLIKLLYSKKEVRQMIEDAVDALKVYLAEGHDLLGYDEKWRNKAGS